MTRIVDQAAQPQDYYTVHTKQDGPLVFFARDPKHAETLAEKAGYDVLPTPSSSSLMSPIPEPQSGSR